MSTETKTYKRNFSFIDANHNKVNLECEINEGRFSISGDMGGAGGQINSHIKPANEAQKKLVDIWDKYHLNDMKAGTEKQEELLNSKEFEEFKKKGLSPRRLDGKPAKDFDSYDWRMAFLQHNNLLEDNGYKYGSAWLKRDLPEDFENDLDSLIDEIEEIEEERKGESLQGLSDDDLIELIKNNTDFSGRDAELAAAFVKMFELSENDFDDIEIDDTRCTVQGVDYIAGNDKEMNKVLIEEVKNSVWAFNASFLASYCDLDKEIFTMLSEKCESANDSILSLVEKSGSIEEFTEEAETADGRAHFLNRYDGMEDNETTIGKTYYYAYRQ